MERFQQVVVNEGHVMYALFRVDTNIGGFIHTQMQKIYYVLQLHRET